MTSIYDPLASAGLHWVFQASLLAVALLLLAGVSIKRSLSAEGGGVIPDEGVTVRNVVELMVIQLAELAESIMGPEYRKHFAVVASIFFFILVSNLMGLIPWLGGATSDVATAAAWAIISFVYYNVVGIKTHGWKYIYQFMGPSLMNLELGGKTYHVRPLTPLFLPLEIVLHFARVATLTIRLAANMFADHTVIMLWIGMIPIVVPAIFMGLGLIISFLQAFVFALLSMIYIGGALEEPH
jgi:F-type H+-transporting ATPase subunit a